MPADSPVGVHFNRVVSRLKLLVRSYGGEKWTNLETAHSYSGAMRRRYVEAERSLHVDQLCSADWMLRAFLKAEKTGPVKDAKPRMIFPRSPRYNLVLAAWLKPFEHWLWGRLTAKRLFNGSNTRVVAKGLSPRGRANLIVRKFNQFERCAVFEVDGKAFEAHVTSGQIRAEHSIYLAAYSGAPGLQSLLSRQFFAGVTTSGLRFSRPGGRASGDYNTGMGNSLLMVCAVVSALKRTGCKFDILADGDNALVFCRSSDLPRVLRDFSRDVLLDSGHEMTLEKPVTILEQIRFGRSAPLFLGPGLGWTMVREPCAVLSGAGASHRWLREPRFARRWLSGVFRCELSLAVGVPVLQSYALSVLDSVGWDTGRLPDQALADYYHVGARLVGPEVVVQPTRECRLSYELAFGLSPDEQILWEKIPAVVGHPSEVVEMPAPSNKFVAHPGLYDLWWDAHL